MTSWARGHAATPEAIDHAAQVAAAIEQQHVEQYVAGRIAAGLEVGHFPDDGTIHLGHYAQDCHAGELADEVTLGADDERTRTLREAHLALDRDRPGVLAVPGAMIPGGLDLGHQDHAG